MSRGATSPVAGPEGPVDPKRVGRAGRAPQGERRAAAAAKLRRLEGELFELSFRIYLAEVGPSLWEMSAGEMIGGRWGTELDEDLTVLEEGRRSQTTRRLGERFPVRPETRAAILRAHGGRCLYCGAARDLHLDHILPVALGGTTEPANLAPACLECNYSKRALRLSVWLRSRPDLDPSAIIERWETSNRRGRLVVEGLL